MEGGRKPVLAKAKDIGVPILVSANSLWRNGTKRFTGFACYAPHDVALDSGGFIAMKKYGGYRWSVGQYVDLAKRMNPAWWAQMDFCCEPEIASNRHEVFQRIDRTVQHLNDCQQTARGAGVSAPMPVLQGWMPQDYCAGPIYSQGFEWPALVGIGSVCRRQVAGKDGIMAVVGALDEKVPKHVKFHLFGVKSAALRKLIENFQDRIASVDSMAWNFSCRKDAFKKDQVCDGTMRARYMEDWYLKQQASLQTNQLQLF